AASSGSWFPGRRTTGTSYPLSASSVRETTARCSWLDSKTSPATTTNCASNSFVSAPIRRTASNRAWWNRGRASSSKKCAVIPSCQSAVAIKRIRSPVPPRTSYGRGATRTATIPSRPAYPHPRCCCTVLGCVKKCEQSLVFFCVVTLPEGQRRLGVYPRPVPGCGTRVQRGVAFGCRTPRYIPLLQTVLVRGCETIGGNTSRSLRKRRNFPQRHYPNTHRYDPWIDEYYYRDNIREIPPTYIDFRGPNEK